MFLKLLNYHWHTTFQLMDLAADLDVTDYLGEPDENQRSIHTLLVHLLQTDYAWRRAMQTGQQQAALPADKFPDLQAVRNGFLAEKEAWQNYLDSLSPGQLQANIVLKTLRGRSVEFPHWRLLQHVVLHGMQHHSELARKLTDCGRSPGDIDFIFYD